MDFSLIAPGDVISFRADPFEKIKKYVVKSKACHKLVCGNKTHETVEVPRGAANIIKKIRRPRTGEVWRAK